MKKLFVLDELKNIRIEDYTYDLPDERIAKFPLEERDASKLLIYNEGLRSKVQAMGRMRPKGELRPQARIEACKVPLRTTAPKGDAALSAQLSPFSFQTMLCAPRAGAGRLKRSCGEDRRARRTGPNACSEAPWRKSSSFPR